MTFLFTDIEGSTRRWSRDPAEMSVALRVHDELLRSVIAAHDGYVFATGGDGLAAAFARVGDAIEAARVAQGDLAEAPWPGAALRVRMGLHLGVADERDGDYLGPVVNLTARLMDVGHGGQVLATEAVAAAETTYRWTDLGQHRLSDVEVPIRVMQLGDARFPALRSLAPGLADVPSPLTSLIGREEEIEAVRGLLDGHRIVTLTGVGGCGKTRLAIEVARRSGTGFPGGVWFVDLSAVTDGSGVGVAVAVTLGLVVDSGSQPADAVSAYLRDRRALVVLDNCEHVADAVAERVEGWLVTCRSIVVVATSRELLDVDGERAFRVPPLGTGPDSLAVQLFRERARSASAEVDDGDDLVTVEQICTALDGLPLAIELAAARCRSMSVSEIAARLDDRFRLLGGSRQRARQRQQTLEGAVQWSYDLLSADEQRLLRALSVFHGGFDPADVPGVAGLDAVVAADLLDALVAKSLVVPLAGRRRLRLLETIRLFALARLVDSGDAAVARDRHLDHFVDDHIVHDFLWLATTDGQRRMRTELDNFTAAALWALEGGRLADVVRIACVIQEAFIDQGRLADGLAWLRLCELADDNEAVFAHVSEAQLCYFAVDIDGHRRAIDSAFGRTDGARPELIAQVHIWDALDRSTGWGHERPLACLDRADTAARASADPSTVIAMVSVVRCAYALAYGEYERVVVLADDVVASRYGGKAVVHSYKAIALSFLGRDDQADISLASALESGLHFGFEHRVPIAAAVVTLGRAGPDHASRTLAVAARECVARHPSARGDFLIAFALFAAERGEHERAEELLSAIVVSALPLNEAYARTFGWQRPYHDALAGYLDEHPLHDRLQQAERQPELLARELNRWT